MEWNQSRMATGVDMVDKQHQEIIRRVNALVEAVKNCGDDVVVPEAEKMLDFLADYVIAHFLSEEMLQMKSNYPELDAHKLEHEGFVERFTAMRDRYGRGGATSSNIQALIDMSENWLVEHIAGSDSRFAAYYRDSRSAEQDGSANE